MPRSNTAFVRKRLYINPDIQGGLISRTTVHWLLYMAAALLTVTIWTAYRNQGVSIAFLFQEVISNFAPVFIAGVVLLPIFLYDQLQQSNRMVGPIFRMRKEMKKLIRGEGVQKLRFRDRDHWQDLAEDFNRLAELVIHNRRSLRHTEEKCEEIAKKTLTKVRRRQLEHNDMNLRRR